MLDWLDKLTFQDIVVIAKEMFFFFLKKWYWFLLAFILGASYGYWKTQKTLPTYNANITFVLSTESPNGNGGGKFSALATQFGLDGGAGGSESLFSGDNIFELFKSRKLIEKALLQPTKELDGCLLSYLYHQKTGNTASSLGQLSKDPNQLNAAQLIVLRKYTAAILKAVTIFKKDKKLSYYTISSTHTDELFAFYAAKNLLSVTSDFFIETKTKVARKNLELLMNEADSLYRLLGGTMERTANIADQTYNINPSMIYQRAPAQLNQARIAALSTAYTEVMRQLELAKISLQKETPLYQVIDESYLPLKVEKPSLLNAVLKDLILSLVLGLVILSSLFFIKKFQG